VNEGFCGDESAYSQTPVIPLNDLSRRKFLIASAATLLLSACGKLGRKPRVGLALGGGGAKGLAHILMLEAFDQLELKPTRIAGTSIGAIIGSLYAAGRSGAEIRALIEQFLVQPDDAGKQLFPLPKSLRWLDFVDPTLGRGGLLSSDDFIEFLGEQLGVERFKHLQIPLQIVAADLWSGEPVVIESGKLLPALQASMALPGVFPPVSLNGRELIDGGVANPLPYDLLTDDCDIVVAVDVSGDLKRNGDEQLSFLNILFHGFHIRTENLVAEKLKQQRPTIYVRPDIYDVRVLEFFKAKQVFDQATPAQWQLLKALKKQLGRFEGQPGCRATGG
jgi:NTE family protein